MTNRRTVKETNCVKCGSLANVGDVYVTCSKCGYKVNILDLKWTKTPRFDKDCEVYYNECIARRTVKLKRKVVISPSVKKMLPELKTSEVVAIFENLRLDLPYRFNKNDLINILLENKEEV